MKTAAAEFARDRSVALLDRLTGFAARVHEDPEADAVHDLRVTIRRFIQALRIFAADEQKRDVRKLRKQLRKVMKAAGEVRDRDIALTLLAEAKVPASGTLSKEIEDERAAARIRLSRKAAKLGREKFAAKWKARFGWS